MSGNRKKIRYRKIIAGLLAGALSLGAPCKAGFWIRESEVISAAETEMSLSTAAESEQESETEKKQTDQQQTISESETKSVSGTDTEAETETETSRQEIETSVDTETELDTTVVPETEPTTESETKFDQNADLEEDSSAESGTASENETGTAPETETDTALETETETAAETETGTAVETETDTAVETETETEKSGEETETEMETETETETGTELETETETEPVCTCGMEEEDPFDHDVDCPVFQEALFAFCNCGNTSRDIYEHSEDCEAYLIWLSFIEGMDAVAPSAMDLTPSGTSVTKASGWTKTNSSSVFSSDYYPVRFYKGISSLEFFNTSSSVVYGKADSGRRYFYPKATGQGGKFGAIYRKVLYENNKWYDLRMTIVNYTSKVECDGTGTTKSFPFIAMNPSKIGWNFNQALGGMVLKCEFYETGTNVKAAVNTRFQWWDIDSGQRFGIGLIDGSIAGRYYYEGSQVYVQKNKTVAEVSGLEVLVGPGENAESTDRKYCVTYELKNCSAYYFSIGKRDHISDDNYSYSKDRIKELNSSLAGGTENVDNHQVLLQSDTSLSMISTPNPVKSVSNDGKTWDTKNQLASVNDTYWYRINQFVPWQDTSVYYKKFMFQDQLANGVSYAGSASVVRVEDGENLTDSFTISESEGKIKVSAKSALLSSSEFYGYHYRIQFKVQLQAEKMTPKYSDNTAVYTVSNQASCIYLHKSESSNTTKKSNTVTTTAQVSRSEQNEPVKSVDGNEQKQEKIILMEDDEIVFDIWQTVPENPVAFRPASLEMEDVLADCLELQSYTVKLQKKGKSEWLSMTGWSESKKGNTLNLSRSCDTSWEGGRLHFQLVCRLRTDVDLSKWKKTETDGSIWTEATNQASVSLTWANGTPQQVTKKTNTVVVRLQENHIRLTKELDGEEIVWAHGNPVFTFCIQGKDLNGESHVYYRSVEFKKEKTAVSGKVTLTAEAIVPAGTWQATEEKTMRYALKEIHGVKNGSVGEQGAVFDLSSGGDGAAVFYNIKTTDQDESHTSFVRNVIG